MAPCATAPGNKTQWPRDTNTEHSVLPSDKHWSSWRRRWWHFASNRNRKWQPIPSSSEYTTGRLRRKACRVLQTLQKGTWSRVRASGAAKNEIGPQRYLGPSQGKWCCQELRSVHIQTVLVWGLASLVVLAIRCMFNTFTPMNRDSSVGTATRLLRTGWTP
jgi:hypothetical protein